MMKKLNMSNKNKLFAGVIVVLLSVLISPGQIFAGGGGGGEEEKPAQAVELDVAVSPTTVIEDEQIEISIGLFAHDGICDPVVTRRPLDIILLIDGSGSMGEELGDEYEGTKIDGALEAVDVFLDNVDPHLDRVGLIVFNDRASVISELADRDEAGSALQNYVFQGGVTETAGFKDAERQFKDFGRSNTSKVVVILSDGQFNSDPSIIASQAEDLKKQEIGIFSIGLGYDTNEDMLRSIASSTSNYFFAPQTSELNDIYQTIARSIEIFNTATDVVVTLTFDKTNFDLIDNSISPEGMRGVDTVTWVVDYITSGQQQMFKVNLQPRISGKFTAVRAVNVTYSQCGQDPKTLNTGERSTINVVGAGGALSSTCIRSDANESRSLMDTVCGTNIPWMWIGAGLVALALLLKWLRENGNALRAKIRCHVPMGFCPWLKLLLYLSLALLAGALLASLTRGVCTPQSGLLFWRILPDGRSSYYVRSIIPDVQPRPLTPLVNEAERVGFFTASDENQRIMGVYGGISNKTMTYDFSGQRAKDIPTLNGSFPAWSPDGTKIAYAFNNEDIYIYDLLTGSNEPLAGASIPDVVETMPAWNHDGSKIAFVHTTAGVAENIGTALNIPCDIWVVSSSGGVATMVPGASGVGFNYHPAFSPDGNWLAFVHHDDGTTTNDDPNADVFIIPASGGLPRAVSNTNDDNGDTMPTWSLDSKKIMFSSRDCGNQYDLFAAEVGSDGTISTAQLMSDVSDDEAFEYLAQEVVFSSTGIMEILIELIPYLILVIILGLLCLIFCKEKTAHNLADTFDYEYLVDPEIGTLSAGKKHEVTIRLWGKKGYGKRKYIKSVDVILLLDRSSSMMAKDESLLRTRLDSAKIASKHFARCVMTPDDRVGIVCFGDDADVIQDLTNNYKEVEKKIDTIDFEGSTNMTAGIQAAYQLLQKSGRKGVKQVIILLSDGGTTAEGTLEAAEKARKDGIRIFTVGTGDADTELLQQIAENPSDFRFVSHYADVEKAFMEAARYLKTKVVGQNVIYTCTYAYDKVDLQIGSIYPRPIKVIQGEITWNFAELIEEKEERFHFNIKPKAEGRIDIITKGDIHYE